jgi:L-ascorbate metabolism protein UlaG (beta-lactamase superfamily)
MIYRSIDLRWLGHSGFKIKFMDKIAYIDPYQLLGDSFEMDKADLIFITHSHYDHCSIEDIQKIARDGTTIICPADVSSKLRHINKKLDIQIAEIGESVELLEGSVKIWAVPAYTIDRVTHEREEDWFGYIIEINGVLIYHAGDTDFIPEMKSIKNIDLALLPIGGANFTMNAGEAAKAASLIKPKIAIPMHYGTLSGVGNKSDAEIFAKYCSGEGIDVKILNKENS